MKRRGVPAKVSSTTSSRESQTTWRMQQRIVTARVPILLLKNTKPAVNKLGIERRTANKRIFFSKVLHMVVYKMYCTEDLEIEIS